MTASDDNYMRVWFKFANICVEIFSFNEIVRCNALMALVWEPSLKIWVETLLCTRCNY
jgi:hypothetical protein